jgi:hypothetical protein
MRVRVRFRYRADTGEVETFVVEDAHDGPPAADHDDRHHRAARAIARVIDPRADVSEIVDVNAEVETEWVPATADEEPARAEDRRLRD